MRNKMYCGIPVGSNYLRLDATDVGWEPNRNKSAEYTLGIMAASGKEWGTMIAKSKISKLKDKLPDNISELLEYIAGKDFPVDYDTANLSKKTGQLKKQFVKDLFQYAFEVRINRMMDDMLGMSIKQGFIGAEISPMKERIAKIEREIKDACRTASLADDLEDMSKDIDAIDRDLGKLRTTVKEVKALIEDARKPTKGLEKRMEKKLAEALDKMEDKYHRITGRRKILV